MKAIFNSFIILLIINNLGAQIAPAVTQKVELANEISLGINFNTLGSLIGGVNAKYSHKKTETKTTSFLIEGVNIKDPKEFKQSTRNTNSSYIYGKYNHLLALRLLYGKNFLLFHKAKDEGLEMNISTSGGMVLGFQKPYYVILKGAPNNDSSGYFKYKDLNNDGLISNQANIFHGLNESKIIPGASLRLSSTFEFGFTKENTLGVEIGAQMDAFSKRIEILNYTTQKQVFITAFVVAYMGIRW